MVYIKFLFSDLPKAFDSVSVNIFALKQFCKNSFVLYYYVYPNYKKLTLSKRTFVVIDYFAPKA